MARAKKGTKEQPVEQVLWASADKLRKNMDAAEYKHIVLGLIFLKYISDNFYELYHKLESGEGDYALQRLRTRVVRKGDFFYPAGYSEIPARKLDNRQIKHISADELASAMYTIVGNCIGTTREALIVETVRAYGFARSGSSITGAMNEAYEQLLAEGKIHEVDGKLLITA
jgi:hypothetical protein